MFNIREYIELDSSNRAACPACTLEGKRGKNLSVLESGAYKCHRGCTPQQIRDALGIRKPQQIPSALAAPTKAEPTKPVTIAPQKVKEAHDQLITKSTLALQWLGDRGFTPEMIQHFRLGIARSKVGDSSKPSKFAHLPSIAIPIPANAEGTAFYQKKRVAPWLPLEERPDGYKSWSQYGIPLQVWLTHLPEEAIETWLCEGEWDAMLLGWLIRQSELPIAVACFTCGCDSVPPANELAKMPGEVVVFYDLDKAGEKGQRKVAEALSDRVRIATVPAPEQHKEGWDISDALSSGFALNDLLDAATAALPPEVVKQPQTDNPLRSRLQWNDDLLDNAPEYTEWLVPDLLTADELFLLAAGPRAGKSLLAMTLSKAVAEGGTFLGRPVTQGTVLYVRCEDGDAKTKEREMAQGWSRGLPVVWLDKFKLSEVNHLREIALELDCRLIVLDTLSRIRDSSISESSAEMSQLLDPLQSMAQEVGCCVLLVHHTGKVSADNAGAIDVFDTIRGSSSIRAVCRGTMIIAASERNYRLCVENGWGKHDLNVVLDANTLTWKLLGNWNPTQNLTQQDQILDCLKRLGVATLEQVHEETGIPKKSLYEQLSRLQASENANEQVVKEGKRRNYTYRVRLFNTIQQLNSVLNSEIPDPDSVRGSIQQNTFFPNTSEKVIISPKSDQNWHSDSSPEPCDSFVNNCETFSSVEYGVEKAKSSPEADSNTNDHFSMITPTPHSLSFVEYPTSNADGESVSPIQQIFNTIQHPPKSDQNWHTLPEGHPLTNSANSESRLEKGDKVEILQAGQLYGKHVFVVQRLRRGRVKVRGENWAIDRTYERSELRLIQRAERGEDDAD